MTALRDQNAVLLFKAEVSEGVDPGGLSASTDAVLVENPDFSFDANVIRTNEVTGSLDPRASIVGGMKVSLSFDIYLKGSGTAGTAPEWGKVLKTCGWVETLTAAAVPVGGPEACSTGGTTSAAVLGATAVGTAQLYRGMPLILSGGVAGTTFISDYTAGKVATLADLYGSAIGSSTSYQIPANVRYQPGSSSIPSATIYLYRDGVVWKFVGFRGDASLNLQAGGPGKISVKGMAMFSANTDAAVPASPVYDATRPPVWKGGGALFNRVAVGCASLVINGGNQLTNPDNPNSAEGFDPAVITKRQMTGTMDPLKYVNATLDETTLFRGQTSSIAHGRYGSVAGNKVGVTIPAALLTNIKPGNRNGLSTVQYQFDCSGQDSGASICLY